VCVGDVCVQELGEGGDVVVVGSKKRKAAGASKEPELSEEAIKSAKKLSKQAQKRFQQIELRKMKEARLDEYHQVLRDHQLNESQRSLLLSTRDIGQKHSQKEQLKRILKKYRAGMHLTAAETEMLFPYGVDGGVSEELNGEEEALLFGVQNRPQNAAPAAREDPSTAATAENAMMEEVDGLMQLDFAAIMSGNNKPSISKPPTSQPNTTLQQPGATNPIVVDNKATSAQAASASTASAPTSKFSFGASLKEQLSNLKPISKSSETDTAKAEVAVAAPEVEEEPMQPYIPVEIFIPAMNGSEVLAPIANRAAVKPHESKSRNVARLSTVPVFRDPEIQVRGI
jgi:hypothetical protein